MLWALWMQSWWSLVMQGSRMHRERCLQHRSRLLQSCFTVLPSLPWPMSVLFRLICLLKTSQRWVTASLIEWLYYLFCLLILVMYFFCKNIANSFCTCCLKLATKLPLSAINAWFHWEQEKASKPKSHKAQFLSARWVMTTAIFMQKQGGNSLTLYSLCKRNSQQFL